MGQIMRNFGTSHLRPLWAFGISQLQPLAFWVQAAACAHFWKFGTSHLRPLWAFGVSQVTATGFFGYKPHVPTIGFLDWFKPFVAAMGIQNKLFADTIDLLLYKTFPIAMGRWHKLFAATMGILVPAIWSRYRHFGAAVCAAIIFVRLRTRFIPSPCIKPPTK